MSAEDIVKVIVHSNKLRDITHANATRLKEGIADIEGKLGLTDGKRVILYHIASKLQMYDTEFHKHRYRLVDRIDNVVEVEVQQKVFDDHDHRMIKFFRQMTKLQSLEKIVKPPPKPVEETIYLDAYNSHLQLIMSRTRMVDESVEQS